MGLRGPKAATDEERAARGMRDRRVRFRVDSARTAWARRAETLDQRGMSLLAAKSPTGTTIKLALALFEAADALWLRLHRIGDAAPPVPREPEPDSLEAFRRRRTAAPRTGAEEDEQR